jgi:type I restriction enzyme S subunit
MSDLPAGWSELPLGSVAEIRVSNVDKKAIRGELPVKLCNYLDVYREDYLDAAHPYMQATATPAELMRFGLRPGDVVITKDSETPDDIGVPAVIDEVPDSLVCGYHLAILRPRETLNSTWLAKQLGHWRCQMYFARVAAGTTRYGLSNASMSDVPILLPPRAEQDRIAEIVRTLDEVIRKTEEVVAKLQQMKQGLLHDLLTRGIDDNGELRDPERHAEQFKESPLARIPRDWEVRPLGALCDLLNGLAFRPEDWGTEGLPIIRIQNLNGSTEFNYCVRRVPKQYVIPPGTVLFSWSGNRGTSFGPYLWNGPTGLLNQHIFRVTLTAGQDVGWFLLALDEVRERVERAAHGGSGLVHVRRGDLLAYLIATPSPVEQERIGSAVAGMNDRITEEQNELEKLNEIKKGLMDDLLAGCVRVTGRDEAAA